DELHYVQGAAAAAGASFVRPGAGPPASVYRRGFAGPGRTLLASAPGAAGAGAFAMLPFVATPAEAAAVLAGEALRIERPPVVAIQFRGGPRPGVGGAEIVLHLTRMLDRSAHGAFLECRGEPLAALPMAERIALASLAQGRLGVRACVLPSDDVTRAYLAERGRDADWRRFDAGDGAAERTLELDLGRIAPAEPREACVRVGAEAEDDDLRLLAAAAARGARLTGVEVVVGGRATRRALEEGGVLAALESAGADVRDDGEARAQTPLDPGSLACADEAEVSAGRAKPISAPGLVASLGFAVPVPERESRRREGAELDPAEVLGPGDATGAFDRGTAPAPPERPAPLEGSPRGLVLVHAAGDLPGERVLAWGPRAQARRGDPVALAALAFDGNVVPLAESFGRLRCAFAIANGRWGEGARDEAVARALVALGVRVVLARTFAPGHARVLAVHGILPLAWRRDVDASRVESFDELELPGLGEAPPGTRRLTVRSLTRGQAFDVDVVVSAAWLELARAGGVLSAHANEAAGV
ncbi:MAG TPA: aconitase family protein, partial [Candidatus Acidoferrales bacterium]|nr:aconitase family protein [Candidatus Acidoferrales bacterium]